MEKTDKIEEIGKVTLDYTYYPGEDYYCDGLVEDELLHIAKNHAPAEFPALIAENIAMDYPEYAFYALIYKVLMWIPLTYVNVAVTVRRLHDLGRNGWFILLSFVPILNLVIGVYVAFFKGKDEDNKYGPSPY